MFIYNLKMNKKALCRGFITICLLIILCIILYIFYIIFIKKNPTCDEKENEIIELNETN